MSESRYPEWQKRFQDALAETDEQELPETIILVEGKICQRLQLVSASCDHHE
jgi:hypothetical protein